MYKYEPKNYTSLDNTQLFIRIFKTKRLTIDHKLSFGDFIPKLLFVVENEDI